MGQPYIGEIRIFAGTFAPNGWLFCEGQEVPIAENEDLFQLIGTTYGGNGETTFRLPDLRGRFPMHHGTGPDGTTYIQGEMAGVETVTLTTAQIPHHAHGGILPVQAMASEGGGTTNSPVNAYFAATGREELYGSGTLVGMSHATAQVAKHGVDPHKGVSTDAGANQPHENMPPFLAINFIISLYGLFPSQT